ncbi:hypothetical protein ACHAXA_004130 [Cyclostephanos tholiformis]|uniref:Uncharacterized protein n=1 Tax=Cyclostephanos tholiformis TaxID=382380 RepID=A0ABD3SHV1_9STRA
MNAQRKRAIKTSSSELPTGRRKSSGIFGTKQHQLMGAILALIIGMILFVQLMAWSLVTTGEQRRHADSRMNTRNHHLARTYIPASTIDLPSYTRDMARRAIRPAPWTCGDKRVVVDPLTNVRPIFSFVHVYKAAGSTLRDFFERYSLICRKSWMVLISCTKVKSSSIRANEDWEGCRVKQVVNGRHVDLHNIDDAKGERPYPTVNNTILRENFDIYGGHIQIGSGDFIHGRPVTDFPSQTPPVRHIVFLRDPMARFVSGIMYEQKVGTIKESDADKSLEGTVALIKKRVRGSRKSNSYMTRSFRYLLTPFQNTANMTATDIRLSTPEENRAKAQAVAAIRNLVHYNVIMGMAEQMDKSMIILRHALVSDRYTDDDLREYIDDLFGNYDNERSTEEETEENGMISRPKERFNLSERNGVSTAVVLQELKKDDDFMQIFQEYVKFEQMIHDFAWEMHKLQLEEATQIELKNKL